MGRRSGSPVIIATSVAIVIGMALAVLWQWADERSTVAAEPTISATADPGIALATPVLSSRRAPGVLARRLNLDQFTNQFTDLAAQVDRTSCFAVSVDGQEVASKNRSVAIMPASTMKLFVAAVALEVLGPGYSFTTTAVGDVGSDGVIAGDLTLVGGGDPLLSTEWWPTSQIQSQPPINVTRLEDLADAVVAAGVTRVGGRVVGDGSRYDNEFFAPSWADEVRVLEAGPYDALLVNDGWTNTSIGDVTHDPALGAAQLFAGLLRERGVRVVGGAASETMPFSTEIASVHSQPLSAVVQEMLLTSDDNTAEMLVKEVGMEVLGSGTTAAGVEAIIGQLLTWNVSIDGLLLVDGSGLSRDSRVTCAALIGVLQIEPPDGPLGGGLPVAAKTGTLSEFFAGSAVAGRMQAKTGTLSGVKSLAGYLPVESGGTIEFVLVQNTFAVDQGGYLTAWEELGRALATYPAAVSENDLAPR